MYVCIYIVSCGGTERFEIVHQRFSRLCVKLKVQESREDHHHEGVDSSTEPLTENPHICFTVASSTMESLCIISTNYLNNVGVFYHCLIWSILLPKGKKSWRKKDFLCWLESLMLGYQAEMLFMIRWWRLWLGETCKCFGQQRANKAVSSLSAPEVYEQM